MKLADLFGKKVATARGGVPPEAVIVRMAPSPTGPLHVGTARTTLFNYLFAKKHGGKFILRIEDTDKERSTKEFEQDILDGLKWLNLEYDELFRQSERTPIYVEHIKKLIESGIAYISKEEPKEEGQRGEVVRFKNPNKKIAFEDLVRGQVEFDTTELGDFVIAKSPEEPLYHFAVVVDDHLMGVTHVIRGEDHVSNTPRQILIQEAIGAKRPIYAHIPLILDESRAKLSKRKHGESVWVNYYQKQGVLPEALLNYLALLGWNPGTDKEIFTLPELVKTFDIKRIQKGGAIFDEKKLDWVNKEHIKLLPPEKQRAMLIDSLKNESYMLEEPILDVEKIAWKKSTKPDAKKHLEHILPFLNDEKKIMAYADSGKARPPEQAFGRGDVLWPLRYALSGAERSTDPFTLIAAIGLEKSKKRVEKAIELLA